MSKIESRMRSVKELKRTQLIFPWTQGVEDGIDYALE